MKNTFSFIMGILVIVLIAGAGYFYFGKSPLEEENLSIISQSQGEKTSANTAVMVPEVPTPETNLSNENPGATQGETKSPKTFTVNYSDSGFNPSTLEINVGDSVTFTKQGSKAMWVASDPHPIHTDFSAFDQKKTGDSYSFTFTKSGTFKFHNHVASKEGGSITVK